MKTLEIQLDDETAGILEALAGSDHGGNVGKVVEDLLARESAILNRLADQLESGREQELLGIRERAERDLREGRMVPLDEVLTRLKRK